MDNVEEIKAEMARIQKDIARAEYERDTAEKAKIAALDNLQELGVTNEEEAEELLVKLRQELVEEMQTIEDALRIVE